MKDTWTRFLDRAILAVVVLSVSAPFSRVPIGSTYLNPEGWSYVALAVILVTRLFTSKSTGEPIPFLLFCTIVGIALFNTLLSTNEPASKVIPHLRSYAPFSLACLVLWTGTTMSPRPILYGYTFAAGIGALAAIYFFYVDPTFLIRVYGDSPETLALIGWGRLPWQNAYLAFFVALPILFIRQRSRGIAVLLKASAIAALGGAIATFSRSLIVCVGILLVFVTMRGICHFRARAMIPFGLMFGCLVVLIASSLSLDSRVQNLFEYRVLGAPGYRIAPSDIEDRASLLDHYLPRLAKHWVSGQGLGVDYTDTDNTSFSDVTFVSFLLPFGVPGVVCFGWLLGTLWVLLGRRREGDRHLAWSLRILIVIGVLMGFNDDIWSHKVFVFLIVFLVASVKPSPRPKPRTLATP